MAKRVLLVMWSLAVLAGGQVNAGTELANKGTNTNNEERKYSEEEFRELVKKSVLESCIKTAPIKDIKIRESSCECYSEKYEKRYSISALTKITGWLNKKPEGAGIVTLMMNPEVVSCGILSE